MSPETKSAPADRPQGVSIRVRGLVQGVGFRPAVWRLANDLALSGDVRNDGAGVLIRLWGLQSQIRHFCARLRDEPPPLARIDFLQRRPIEEAPPGPGFQILASETGEIETGIVPDAATCPACLAETLDPADRRFRYPFTNCTHCGPRLTIVRAIPYDRANTSMDAFAMCPACRQEYEDPANRRFHAQPNACAQCGPRVWLEDSAGNRLNPADLDAADALAAVSRLLENGRIVAIKGIGGFHLACDAANAAAVAALRQRKRRFDKPFALMAADLQTIRRFAFVSDQEAALLSSPAAPILLLERRADAPTLAPEIAPRQTTLGFMLPYSPLHHLVLSGWDRPLVMTSGNLSDEPQCTENSDAESRLGAIADYFVLHNRPILNRVDDSVMRVMAGAPHFLRRARGFSPGTLTLPRGIADAPPIIALGGELKTTLCLTKAGHAVLTQHLGDLEDARTAGEYERILNLYLELFVNRPELIAVDAHPGYRSTQLGRRWAERERIMLTEVQHHHAHIASVLADNHWPRDAGPVLGIALDGLGYGDDGTLWGGEFLMADYTGYRRIAHLKPAPMPGGVKAILEPWRNTWAHLRTHLGWEAFMDRWGDGELAVWLSGQPLTAFEQMAALNINSPLSSSCGRLFDAVAAALDVRREAISYEGQAAIELEALALQAADERGAYPLTTDLSGDVAILDPSPLWREMLDDMARRIDPARIAMRFHRGLAFSVAALARGLCERHNLTTIALSGGVFQNRTFTERLLDTLRQSGVKVLVHRQVPTNDVGLSLGQAAVAAARAASGPR